MFKADLVRLRVRLGLGLGLGSGITRCERTQEKQKMFSDNMQYVLRKMASHSNAI